MPNTFFKFKQFTVHQEDCAMKVCTEACLFGAWLASIVKQGGAGTVRTLLDIGAGTGLLSLMLAQATNARIDAVELDEKAAAQALNNFKDSPWQERLSVVQASIQEYSQGNRCYDFLFSNPPFYNNDLRSNDRQRNMALHDDSLTLEQLLSSVNKLLREEGYFAVLIPFPRGISFEMLISRSSLRILKKLNLRQTPQHSYFRSMYLLCRTDRVHPIIEEEIIIRNDSGYTPVFRDLLKDYYLDI